jgi:hypothetical protein
LLRVGAEPTRAAVHLTHQNASSEPTENTSRRSANMLELIVLLR